MTRLTPGDVACWVLKSIRPPHEIVTGRWPGTEQDLTRCVRPSYRLGLMTAGAPVLPWVSGRRQPVVAAGPQFVSVLARVRGGDVPAGLGPWSA